jgi:hypothetical protein
MTVWRHSEAAEKDVSDIPDVDWQIKRRRSRRGWRDAFADQTVIQNLEYARSYRAFERALIGSIEPRSVLEFTLVHRLASLLWRLRRAIAIETGLFELQGELLAARWHETSRGPRQPTTLQTPPRANGHKMASGANGRDDPPASNQEPLSTSLRLPFARGSKSSAIAQYFLGLSKLDPTLLDRVGSYEAGLWRQAAQTIWTLEAMRRPQPALTRRPFRLPDRHFGRHEPL